MKTLFIVGVAAIGAAQAQNCAELSKANCGPAGTCVFTDKTCKVDEGCPTYVEKMLCQNNDGCVWTDLTCKFDVGCAGYEEKTLCLANDCWWDITTQDCSDEAPTACEGRLKAFCAEEDGCVWTGTWAGGEGACVVDNGCLTYQEKMLCRERECWFDLAKETCTPEFPEGCTCCPFTNEDECERNDHGCSWDRVEKLCSEGEEPTEPPTKAPTPTPTPTEPPTEPPVTSCDGFTNEDDCERNDLGCEWDRETRICSEWEPTEPPTEKPPTPPPSPPPTPTDPPSVKCHGNKKSDCRNTEGCVWTGTPRECHKDTGCKGYGEKQLCLSKYCHWDSEFGTGCQIRDKTVCHDHVQKHHCTADSDCNWTGYRCVNRNTCWVWEKKYICRRNNCFWDKSDGNCKMDKGDKACNSFGRREQCRKAGCAWSGQSKSCYDESTPQGCDVWGKAHKCKHQGCHWDWFAGVCTERETAHNKCARLQNKMNSRGCAFCLNGGEIGPDGSCVCADGFYGDNCLQEAVIAE